MAEIVELKKNGKQLVMTFDAYLSVEDILRAIADENGVDVNDLSEEEIINDIAQSTSADRYHERVKGGKSGSHRIFAKMGANC